MQVHANLVKVLGFCRQPQAVVYEWVGGGNLQEILKDCKASSRMPLGVRIKLMLDVARGLEHLHCRSSAVLRHNDIKPQNILLVEGWSSAKLADYAAANEHLSSAEV